MLVACGNDETEAAAAAAATPAAGTATPSAPAGGASALCQRAAECCRAYVATMPAAAQQQGQAGCTAAEASTVDSACQAMINGWKQAMTAMGTAIPASCN